jgi:hypothetical protein
LIRTTPRNRGIKDPTVECCREHSGHDYEFIENSITDEDPVADSFAKRGIEFVDHRRR